MKSSIAFTFIRSGIYLFVALIFGFLQWFAPLVNLMPQLARAMQGWLEYVVWLIPGLIVAFIEAHRSSNTIIICLQTVGFLLAAIIGYYAGYAWDVFIIGETFGLTDLAVGTSVDPAVQWRFFVDSIFPEMVEWGLFAIVTGLVLGIVAAVVKRFVFSKR